MIADRLFAGAGTPHVVALLGCILCTSAGQVFLKAGAVRGTTYGASLKHPFTSAGYGLFAVNTVLAVIALQRIPLHVVTAWTALNFVLVPLLGRIAFGERYTLRTLTGAGLIVAGIVVFYWP